jgi:hypothetical protein
MKIGSYISGALTATVAALAIYFSGVIPNASMLRQSEARAEHYKMWLRKYDQRLEADKAYLSACSMSTNQVSLDDPKAILDLTLTMRHFPERRDYELQLGPTFAAFVETARLYRRADDMQGVEKCVTAAHNCLAPNLKERVDSLMIRGVVKAK